VEPLAFTSRASALIRYVARAHDETLLLLQSSRLAAPTATTSTTRPSYTRPRYRYSSRNRSPTRSTRRQMRGGGSRSSTLRSRRRPSRTSTSYQWDHGAAELENCISIVLDNLGQLCQCRDAGVCEAGELSLCLRASEGQ